MSSSSMSKSLTVMNKDIQGFTLIELVTVIVILGILAVVALPKYINLQDDANYATVQASAGALSSGVRLAHSKFLVKGNTFKATIKTQGDKTFILIDGNKVYINGLGWPECSTDTGAINASKCGDGVISSSKRECTSIWNALINSDQAAPYYKDWVDEAYFNFEPDSPVSSVSNDSDSCQYTLVSSYPDNLMCIRYETETGKVWSARGSDCSQDRKPSSL